MRGSGSGVRRRMRERPKIRMGRREGWKEDEGPVRSLTTKEGGLRRWRRREKGVGL